MTLPGMLEIENENKAHGGESSIASAYINPIRPCALILFILGFLKFFNCNTMLKFLDFFRYMLAL